MTRPNLLFIMTDQQKATSLDLYNNRVNFIQTTSLKDLSSEGVVFDLAYCPYPLCAPSRISMLTGVYPSSSGHIGNSPSMGDKYETIFSCAKKHGYTTMLLGKDHAYCNAAIGGDRGNHPAFMDRIFDQMYCALHNDFQPPEIERDLPHIRPWLQNSEQLHCLWGSEIAPWDSSKSITARLCDIAVERLDYWKKIKRNKDTPFAMWLSFPDPHELYQAPRDVVDMIKPDSVKLPPNWQVDISCRAEYIQFMHWYFNNGKVPEKMVKQLIRVYLAMCKNVDIQLGKIFEFLKKNGEWENTVILYTSDHGDLNGEHQLIQKFNCGYDGCCRIPLIIAWPGHSVVEHRYEYPVNLADIPSTLCDIMGWEHFTQDQGQSLAKIIISGLSTAEDREYTVVESGLPGKSLTVKDIANFPGHRYDIKPVGRWCYDPPHRFGGKMYAVRSKDYKLIVRQNQDPEFYDMRSDPWETQNLFAKDCVKDEITRHYRYLTQHLARISYKLDEAEIATQDNWYECGGDKTWQQSLPAAIKDKTKGL